jgi:hypothetical protein
MLMETCLNVAYEQQEQDKTTKYEHYAGKNRQDWLEGVKVFPNVLMNRPHKTISQANPHGLNGHGQANLHLSLLR